MKTICLLILQFLLSNLLFSQILVAVNGTVVKPNNSGISVTLNDEISVSILNNNLNLTCIKSTNLQVSITKKTDKQTMQQQQQQQQQQQKDKHNKQSNDICNDEKYRKLKFKLTKENILTCRFKVRQYWKEYETRSYIYLCHQGECDNNLSSVRSEIIKYFFFLMK